ncbi:MAG: RES family NAD+ phosphorylase [Burkholderiales bacterium]
MTAEISHLDWFPCYRLIPSRFPPIGLFDRVASLEDLEAVSAIESLTNDRLRDEIGEISLAPPEERIVGPGASPIMAAFTHLNPEGSRFSDGTYGVYYAGESLDTSIPEVAYHRTLFLSRTREAAMEIDLRTYTARVVGDFHDLRGQQDALPDFYARCDYAASQALGRSLRASGSSGVVYDSVRRAGGQCVAVFRPRLISDCSQSSHITFVWDGARIVSWYEKSELRNL